MAIVRSSQMNFFLAIACLLTVLRLQGCDAFTRGRCSILSRTTTRRTGNSLLPLKGVSREAEDEAQKMDMGKMVEEGEIPYGGMVGKENGALFDKPLQPFDPLKNTEDLPGVDGSPEKIAAIQNRIQARVDELKKAGEWGDDTEAYGKDPLASQSLVQTMQDQVKACKPFETYSELALTYVLVIGTTIALSTYLLVLRDSFDTIMGWFVTTDFDADFGSNLFKSLK